MPDLPARAADVAARPPPRRLALPTPRVALVIAAALVIGVVLYLGRSALTPFVVGLLLIYLLDPAVGWVSRLRIGRFGVPRGLAVLIVYAITIVVVVVALRLLLAPLVSQLLAYVSDFPRLLSSIDSTIGQLRLWYLSLDLPDAVRSAIDEAIAGAAGAGVDLGALLPVARSILGTAAGFFGFLIIPIWAFYILRDRVQLTDMFANSLPASWRDEVWAVLSIIERVVGRWIRAQIVLGLVVGVATYVGLIILGWTIDPQFIQFAVLLAVIAGILELLPIIGPILSAIPTLVVALTTSDPLLAVIAVIVLYVVVQQVEGAVLVPKIQGSAVQLHPSLIIFALIIGGSIAGLLGAILAIPITAAGRDVYRYLFRRLSDEDEVPSADVAEVTAPDVPEDEPASAADAASPEEGSDSDPASAPSEPSEPADPVE
jgi:predicted PurR-regulated permease PerM